MSLVKLFVSGCYTIVEHMVGISKRKKKKNETAFSNAPMTHTHTQTISYSMRILNVVIIIIFAYCFWCVGKYTKFPFILQHIKYYEEKERKGNETKG